MDSIERVIIADPKGRVWKFAESVYQEILKLEEPKEKGTFVLRKLNNAEFPDGEFEPRIDSNCRQRSIIFIHDSSKEPSRWLTELCFVNSAAMRASANSVTDVLPYMRWTRGEKKDKPHIPIVTRAVADMISSSLVGVPKKRIINMDLHSKAIEGFFNFPVDSLESQGIVADYLIGRDPERAKLYTPVAPDSGSSKRVGDFANVLSGRLGIPGGLDIAIIDKDRVDGSITEVKNIIGREYVKDRIALMIDDIFASGGTAGNGTDALRFNEVIGVEGVFTHPVFCKNYRENLAKLDKVYITDTFYQDVSDIPNLEVITTTPLLAKAIYAAELGKSISKLFED